MRLLRTLLVALLALSLSCATVRQQVQEQEASIRRDMQDQTVHLEITLAVKRPSFIELLSRALGAQPDLNDGEDVVLQMACSGVVVDKSGGIVRKPLSLIATAHHCLDVGPGTELDDGSIVTAVIFTAKDSNGRQCGLTPILLGGYGPDDVATGVASCDLGVQAELADAVPQRQEQIYISGHPLGVYPGLITTGYVSGWLNGWILLSAPAWGGNSGGPVYNSEGEVIGLLVRGSREYSQLTLAAPLGELQDRIKASGDWASFPE
jgi:S1-C subfamily serine protease